MEVICKCGRHGSQIAIRMTVLHFQFELSCGCIYNTSLHGNWYRRMTTICDHCDKVLQGSTFKDDGYTTMYYHIHCIKDLEKRRREKIEGTIVDIEEEYEKAKKS